VRIFARHVSPRSGSPSEENDSSGRRRVFLQNRADFSRRRANGRRIRQNQLFPTRTVGGVSRSVRRRRVAGETPEIRFRRFG